MYALGATMYALLAGRSPFELPGGPNNASALIARIEREAVQPTGRRESVPLLDQVAGPQHAQALRGALPQRVRVRARGQRDRASARPHPDPGRRDGQRGLRGPNRGSRRQHPDAWCGHDRRRHRAALDPDPVLLGSDGRRRGATGGNEHDAEPRSASRLLVAVGLLVVLVDVVVAVVLFSPRSGPPTAPTGSPRSVVAAPPPGRPVDLSCARDGGSISCTWTAPSASGDDLSYQWNFAERDGDKTTVDRTRFTPAGVQACVQVRTISSGRSSEPVSDCVE